MKFNYIDMSIWERRECFEHFTKSAGCSYSITVNMDITKLYKYLKDNEIRIYAAFTWIVSRSINSLDEFKMGYDEKGRLGYYDKINPCYSVLNDLCTQYNEDMA